MTSKENCLLKAFWFAGNRQIACFLLFSFISFHLFSQEPNIPLLKAAVQKRIDTYLDKEHKLSDYYSITDEGFNVFESPAQKLKNEAEFTIRWKDYDEICHPAKGGWTFPEHFHMYPLRMTNTLTVPSPPVIRKNRPQPTDSLPLNGIYIALDPGHLAGNLENGRIEQKYICIPKENSRLSDKDLELVEGHLTLGTALVLKEKLEKAGASVMMTHDKPDMTALGITYEEWLKTGLKRALDSLVRENEITKEKRQFYLTTKDKRKIFRDIFRDIELKARAGKINTFNPDITVIIHYNVDETNTDWKKLSSKNFVMTFIGGAMLPSELNKEDKRFEFFRMALTPDIEKSQQLSAKVVKEFSEILKVPIANKKDALYLDKNCLATTDPGVFCRNLILTRIIHSPLVYGETLYQDNQQECFRLMDETSEIKGIPVSTRVREVAEAYYKGILDYYRKQ